MAEVPSPEAPPADAPAPEGDPAEAVGPPAADAAAPAAEGEVPATEGEVPAAEGEAPAEGAAAEGEAAPAPASEPVVEEPKIDQEELDRIEAARLRVLVETAREEISGLKQENVELQRRVCTMQKKRRSIDAEQFILEGQEAYYQARLANWSETKIEFNRLKDEYDKKIDSLRERLQEKQNESNARHEGMIHYFWKLEQEERDSIVEMQAVRIRGRQLKSQLAKLERKLELKDQLPGNLHLVDYEQLKMENESLNEKIHMKNEALSTLRKKTSNLVHMLTHVREKLQFLVVECKVNGEALANDDKTLHGGRIKLSRLKSSIMAIKRKKEALQKNVVNVTSPMMLDDMDYQREDIDTEEATFQDLKKRYHDLTVKIEEYKNKLYCLGALPMPVRKVFTKTRPATPPIERGSLRWGTRREALGQMVVSEMVARSLSP